MIPENKTFYNKLLSLLQRDLDEIKAVSSLLERKREALLDADEDRIRECMGELLDRKDTLRALEEERFTLCGAVAKEWGVPAETLRLKTIIEKAPPEIVILLEKFQENLRHWAKSVDGLNRENRKLARSSLEIINNFLEECLLQQGENYITYGEAGKLKEKGSRASAFCHEY